MKPHPTLRVGIFDGLPAADRAVHALLRAGYTEESLSVVCPHSDCEVGDGARHVEPSGSHTPQAVAAGSAIGSVLGGLTAAVGIATTGGTALLVVGPLLYGALGGGIAGGFLGAMATRGLEPEIADFYDQALEKGQVLVAVEELEGAPPLDVAERVLAESGANPMAFHKS
jgi:hypothetical protein